MSDSPVICLYIARHGATTLNQKNMFRGNKDVPLAPEGVRDAHHLKTLFADVPLSFIISSDKQRAVQTANIIGEGRTDVPQHVTPTLRALDVGDFSGLRRDKKNTDALQHYIDNPDETIPGGESLNHFKSRIQPALWEAFEMADDAGCAGLVVAHSSIIHELGAMLYDNDKSVLVQPGGVATMHIGRGLIGASAVYKAIEPPADEQRADTIS